MCVDITKGAGFLLVLWYNDFIMGIHIEQIQQQIIPVLKSHGVARSAIFGSFARGEETVESDVDLLIEFKGKKNLLDLVDLKMALKEALHKEVDLVTYRSISPLLKEKINKEAIQIYG